MMTVHGICPYRMPFLTLIVSIPKFDIGRRSLSLSCRGQNILYLVLPVI
jgi:hypothetical protein